jgi:[acyl-carrier-protein] S-malonyltransferase
MPGQGAQYQGMGTGLYRDLPAFARVIDGVFVAMGGQGDELRADWLAAEPRLPMEDVRRSQPLLFAIDYALGKLLMNLGLRPGVLLGHSIGEMAAATLAGVFDLEHAVGVVQHRISSLAGGPAGGMLAVAASRQDVEAHLRPGADIAAINAPRQTIIAGAPDPLRATSQALQDAGFTVAPVFSLTPFHSAVLEPVADQARELLAGIPMRPPGIGLMSGYTARPLTGSEATDPKYWARQLVDPVLFWPALRTLLATGPHVLIECGPGQGLITLARRHPDVRAGRCVVQPLLGTPKDEAAGFAAAIERLRLPTP